MAEVVGTWNHRVLAHEHNGEMFFEIHEVHYEGEVPKMYTVDSVSVSGESIADLRWVLDKMQSCLDKPVLWKGDKFPQEYEGGKP
jgi:hypothetical protein